MKTLADDATTRRGFIKESAGALALGTLATHLPALSGAFAAGTDIVKVGLVGCGGRGSGAAAQALQADTGARLTGMADMFADRLATSLGNLRKTDLADRVLVDQDHQFVGPDAYKRLIDSGVDVVLLATPPHFRPAHLSYAVEKGKHVFCEKPVAVDATGVRSVFATVAEARRKNLSLVSGLCWRYDLPRQKAFEKVHAGALGEIRAIQATYHTSTLKKFPRRPGWTDMEFQLRNWQHFTWLSGDHNVEQHVHNLDSVLWLMNDVPPVRCAASGGRQARTGEESGDVYDHFSTVYEWANGVKTFSSCRQIDGADNDISDHVWGTKGYCDVFAHKISGETNWQYAGPRPDRFQVEHNVLFQSIREGRPINNGDYMTKSTLMGVMARMSAYTGKSLTWDQALESREDLTPASYEMGPAPVPTVAIPGVTRLV